MEGLGAREAKKSPYAGPSWSLTSGAHKSVSAIGRRQIEEKLTIDRLALGQIGVILACEEAIPIPSDNTLDIAGAVSICTYFGHWNSLPAVDIEKKALHGELVMAA